MKTMCGYTLIEIMVALAVFAILSAMTASSMHHAFNIKERVNAQANQLNTLQLAISLFTQDTEQVIDRPIVGNEMRSFPPFVGESHYLELTRGGSVNPNEIEHRSTLKRIAYLCKENKLIRRSWASLDTPQRNQYHDAIILEKLNGCSFSYIAANKQTLNEWHDYAVQQNQNKESFPSAIQLNVSLDHWGKINLIFPLTEATYGATN